MSLEKKKRNSQQYPTLTKNLTEDRKKEHYRSSDFLHDSRKKFRKYFIATYTMLRDTCLEILQRSDLSWSG